jgi:hypothetical protein
MVHVQQEHSSPPLSGWEIAKLAFKREDLRLSVCNMLHAKAMHSECIGV